MPYRVPAERRGSKGIREASDPEEVLPEDNPSEGLVLQEHVDGAGVRQLPGVIGFVFHAAVLVQLAGIVLLRPQRGHKIGAGEEPVRVLVEQGQVDGHGVGGASHGASLLHQILVHAPGLVKVLPEAVHLSVVEQEPDVLVEVHVVLRIQLAHIVADMVHEVLFCQHVPRDVGVEVGMPFEQLLEDVVVDVGMKVGELLAKAEMGPDHDEVLVAGEDGVPDLEVLDLGEGLAGPVVREEEGVVEGAEDAAPPDVVLGGQLDLLIGHLTS